MARKVTDPRFIVDAAAEVFRKNGYGNATIADVARKAGISKPTLYQYVTAKSDLLRDIFEIVLARVSDIYAAVQRTDLEPREQLREAIRQWTKATSELNAHFAVVTFEESDLPPDLTRQMRAWERRNVGVLRDIMARCAAVDSRVKTDPAVAAYLVAGMIGATPRWFNPVRGPMSSEELADQIIAVLEGSLLQGACPGAADATVTVLEPASDGSKTVKSRRSRGVREARS